MNISPGARCLSPKRAEQEYAQRSDSMVRVPSDWVGPTTEHAVTHSPVSLHNRSFVIGARQGGALPRVMLNARRSGCAHIGLPDTTVVSPPPDSVAPRSCELAQHLDAEPRDL